MTLLTTVIDSPIDSNFSGALFSNSQIVTLLFLLLINISGLTDATLLKFVIAVVSAIAVTKTIAKVWAVVCSTLDACFLEPSGLDFRSFVRLFVRSFVLYPSSSTTAVTGYF